jgi:hypothetical protein
MRRAWLLLSFAPFACSDDGAPIDTSPDTGAATDDASASDSLTSGVTTTLGTSASSTATASESDTSPTTDDPTVDPTQGDTSGEGPEDTGVPLPDAVPVQLVPQDGVSGVQRINFAIPFDEGQMPDVDAMAVMNAGAPVDSGRRVLAMWPDGSARAIQIQLDLDVGAGLEIVVELGTPSDNTLALVPVADTLVAQDGTAGPRVWALLPADLLSSSRFAGPQLPVGEAVGDAAAWDSKCDYEAWGIDTFLQEDDATGSWLYDRGTALYRGYARTGELLALSAAYRETAIYVAGSQGAGADVVIPVPDAADDLKYHYAQHAALHYLLTGDDRFREYAESIALRVHDLWGDPGYGGGADFWTERHAGFALLAYVAAAQVSDDMTATFDGWADEAVAAYIEVQDGFPPGYDDPDARCFAHEAEAHGEDYGYVGCSPWMSAILADGLEAYARERDGEQAAAATNAIARLGRIIARDGRDGDGRPFYWMGVGTDADVIDEFEEHWGESAYIVAMAWWYDGQSDDELRAAADGLVTGFANLGEVGQLRSFNWQCRSAVATPWYLQR